MKQNASWILTPVVKCPEAIKAHRPLALINTTSSDIQYSVRKKTVVDRWIMWSWSLIITARHAIIDYYTRTCNSWPSGSLQICEEKEIVESFSYEILLHLYLPSSLIPTAHCTLTTMDIFFRLRREPYKSRLCGYASRVLVKIYRRFGRLLEFPDDGSLKILRNPCQLFINIHDLVSD
jgi:hypothetical protein